MGQSIHDLHAQLIAYLEEGKFAEGIEDFYADDVIAREGQAEANSGREALAAAERTFLEKVTAYHGIEVHATAIDETSEGNGTVFYEATMRWDQSDKGAVVVEQAIVERWADGKVADIRFYGNFEG